MNPMMMQNIMNRANQMMKQLQNPQQLVRQMMPGIPEEIQSDPNKIINWMQQNGKITEQQIQMARQMMGQK